MNRLRMLQTSAPLPLFGHKIREQLPDLKTPSALPANRQRIASHAKVWGESAKISKLTPTSQKIPQKQQRLTMHIAVEAGDVAKLRQLAATVCGDNLSSIRVQPIAQARRMNVWLSLKYDAKAFDSVLETIMTAIMRHLPCAQFGHFEAV